MENRFRVLRKAHALSQQDLAKLTGMSQNTISRLETGDREPAPSSVRKLAAFYNVPTTYLMGLNLPPREVELVPEREVLPPSTIEIVEEKSVK